MTIETNFLTYAAEKLDQLAGRIETCLRKILGQRTERFYRHSLAEFSRVIFLDRISPFYGARSVAGSNHSPHVVLHRETGFLGDLVIDVRDARKFGVAEEESHLSVVHTVLISLD